MIDRNRTNTIFWPPDPEDGVAEPPIAIGVYCDGTIELRQQGRHLIVQRNAAREFCRAILETIKRDEVIS